MGEIALEDPAQAATPEALREVEGVELPGSIPTKPEWVQEVIDVIQESIPPRASWRVIERCIARATSRYRVGLVGKEDMRGPRVIHPAAWDPVPERFSDEAPGKEFLKDSQKVIDAPLLDMKDAPPSEAPSVPEGIHDGGEVMGTGEVPEGLPGGEGGEVCRVVQSKRKEVRGHL